MSILTPRVIYSPFEYEKAYQYWEMQQQSHWLHTEVQMQGDVSDWKILKGTEQKVIGNTLKGFTQSEIFIADYWTSKVQRWFKKPEIQMMAQAFGSMESVHAVSYAYLNQTLGIEDFEAFLHEPAAKAKIDRLIETGGKSKQDIARSLAIFSAFNEGVNLFSSFAILLSFGRRNLLKGLARIIAFSIKDESLHSEAGCWLFRTFVSEFPEIMTDEFKKELYDAARLTIQLEDAFIDQAFSGGEIEGINAADLKVFIRDRANAKLQDIGLKTNWKNLDKEALRRMSWFEEMTLGEARQDFFVNRVSSYAKGVVQFNDDVFSEDQDIDAMRQLHESHMSVLVKQ